MNYIAEIKQILQQARQNAYSAVNSTMVEAYWLIGKRIVEEEQSGKDRADYGMEILKNLSKELTVEFGKGFSITNLKNFRKFYLVFCKLEKGQTVSAKLSWSHFERLIRVENEQARNFYLTESAEQNWSVRTLDRNISTQYYHRILASQIKEPVIEEMKEKTKNLQANTFEFIKNPSVLEFLNLPSNMGYTESALEKALIDNLKHFLLELGKGYAFVERQQLVKTETDSFYIDLVFYNYILKCFVIIELKTHKITHQDVGQLDMYVRMYDDLKKQKSDNPTIGILLCTETDNVIAKYSVLNQSQQLFASKYMRYLPTEEELIREIEREKEFIRIQLEKETGNDDEI